MYENGAANTSFEDVRKAAKASGSQMSHYFADKRSLIRAVIAHQSDAVMANHHDPAIGNLDSIAALRTWAQRRGDFGARVRCRQTTRRLDDLAPTARP
jgi:AcrR family transcriptional regulator